MKALTPELFQHTLSAQKKVFAWGVAATLPYVIHQYGFRFAGIIDGQLQTGSPQSQGQRFGLDIYSPGVLKQYSNNDVIIIVVADIRQFGEAITRQIEGLGDYTVCYLNKPVQQLTLSSTIPDFTFTAGSHEGLQFAAERVCLCIPSLSFGGAERQMYLVAKGFLTQGYEVHLITWTSSQPADWLNELTALGVIHHAIDTIRATVDATPEFSPQPVAGEVARLFMAKEFFLLERLYLLLGQIRPAKLLAFMDQTNIFAGLAASFVNVPKIVLSVRSAKPDIYHTLPDYLTLSDVAQLYQRILTKPNVALYTNPSAAAEYYQQWLSLNAPLPVVDNACELHPVGQDERVNRLIADYKQGPLICAAMRLTEVKNPLLFVDIIKGITQVLPETKAILLGDGEMRAEVEQQIRRSGLTDQVMLMGNVTNVHEYFHHADVFIQTSVVEGYPNALVEAILYGCQAVATDVGDTQRVMSKFGFKDHVFKSQNAEQAVKIAVSLLNQSALLATANASQLRRIRDEMQPARVCERIVNL